MLCCQTFVAALVVGSILDSMSSYFYLLLLSWDTHQLLQRPYMQHFDHIGFIFATRSGRMWELSKDSGIWTAFQPRNDIHQSTSVRQTATTYCFRKGIVPYSNTSQFTNCRSRYSQETIVFTEIESYWSDPKT